MPNHVEVYYNENASREHKRLDLALGRIEFLSTVRLIDKYFPKGGNACDIGGGTGRYTSELLRRGYVCDLIDLSSEEIDIARKHLKSQNLTARSVSVGNATSLDTFTDETFDCALLLGPMYHITEPTLRRKALTELNRVLKKSGVALVSFINAWGLLRTGISDFPAWYRDSEFSKSMLQPKVFRDGALKGFTDSVWTTPEAARLELQVAGFEVVSYAGAQGFAAGMKVELEKILLEDPELHENISLSAAEMCELPQFRDSTEHVVFVAKKT